MSQVPQKQNFGLFRGITGTKPNIRGNYERVGHYLEKIVKIKAGRKFNNEEFLAVEKQVVHVLNDAEGQGHRVGEEVTHMMLPRFPSFKGNVVAMVAGIMGCDPDAVTDELFEHICSDAQPLSGWTIECFNRMTNTRANKPFTDISYRRYVPASELMEILTAEEKARFYPGDTLEKLREQELAAQGQ